MIFLKYDRRIFQNFDWTLFALVMSICAIGIINIYSTGFSLSDNQSPLYIKQLQWIMFGLFLMLITFLIDYRAINQAAYVIYAISVASLVVCGCIRSHGQWRAKMDLFRIHFISTFRIDEGDHYYRSGQVF